MNEYEQKQAARKAYYENKAAAAAGNSDSAFDRARAMGSVIPPGQPILVGHHSESGDRSYRGSIERTFQKGVDQQEKSEYYEHKAASVGSGGISSDDPDAIEKLRVKLSKMEADQALMKAANRIARSKKKTDSEKMADLGKLGISEVAATKLLEPVFGRVGFEAWELSNNNANIRRVKTRIVELEAAQERTDVEETYEGFIYREDTGENRVMFEFDGKPDEDVRTVLKSHGFKWSPSRMAWVRQLNENGIWGGRQVKMALQNLEV